MNPTDHFDARIFFFLNHHLVHIFLKLIPCIYVLQSCPAVCDPMDCSQPGSSVHGIFQARILERVVMPSFRGIFLTRDGQGGLACCDSWGRKESDTTE